ncbi:MAG: PRC-barrel domain-containing protein [Bryobacterales bacterium]|nr:PRC-barrel domain-containing protein [Acidobacteriota bacterium]MCB9386132.1 PRC-barrel domain-containing protein [Bryobacterales bacterium]
MNPVTLSATTINGDKVVNPQGDDLGKIEDLMIDLGSGRISYAVLSFGGFMGIGDKLFALPWPALELDSENHRFILDVPKDRLEQAPGFDKDRWPNMADRSWGATVHEYYGQKPYWAA